MQRVSACLLLASLAGAPLVALGSGCAHRDPADRSIEQLRADITKLQADRDRQDERLAVLEGAESERDRTEARKSGGTLSPTDGPRRLPVVRVGSGEPAPSEGETVDEHAADPRPMVEATGAPASAKRGRASSRSDDGATSPALSPEAKRDYEAALALARSKQHDKALDALTSFLVRYPDHPYAENAMYWRGECFYAKGEYARAAEQFEGLMARYPYGNKAADGLLKLGLCQQRLGSQEQAQKTFNELKERYPKSDAARQIPRP